MSVVVGGFLAGVFCGHDMFDCTLKARLLASWQPEQTSEVKKLVAPFGPTMTRLDACDGMPLGITATAAVVAASVVFGASNESSPSFA